MKSLFISTIIIIILITSWIFIYTYIGDSVAELDTLLNEMEKKVYDDKWESTLSIYESVYQKWGNKEKILMLIVDHEEMEKINLTLDKIKKYISLKNKSLTLGETATLKYLLHHVKEKEALSLKNIF